VTSGDLDASRAAYARALLAGDLAVVRRELELALRSNPRNRAAHEMLVTLVLLTDGSEAGAIAAQELSRLYPDHPGARWIEAFCALRHGQEDEARVIVGADPKALEACKALSAIVELNTEWGRSLAAAMVDVGVRETHRGPSPPWFVLQGTFRVAALAHALDGKPTPLRWAPRLRDVLIEALRVVQDEVRGQLRGVEGEERVRALTAELPMPLVFMQGAHAAFNDARYDEMSPWFEAAIHGGGLFALPREMTLCWLYHAAHDRHEAALRGEQLDAGKARQMRALVDEHVLRTGATDRELAFVCTMFAKARLSELARSTLHRLHDQNSASPEVPSTSAWVELFDGNHDGCAAWIAKVPEDQPSRRAELERFLALARGWPVRPR
jgi:hypothetical protein